jgi:hypothetical protein
MLITAEYDTYKLTNLSIARLVNGPAVLFQTLFNFTALFRLKKYLKRLLVPAISHQTSGHFPPSFSFLGVVRYSFSSK